MIDPTERELNELIRELRDNYRTIIPFKRPGLQKASDALADDVHLGTIKANDMWRRYITVTYARTGSMPKTAKALGIGNSTVQENIDHKLLAKIEADDLNAISPLPNKPNPDILINRDDWVTIKEAARVLGRRRDFLALKVCPRLAKFGYAIQVEGTPATRWNQHWIISKRYHPLLQTVRRSKEL